MEIGSLAAITYADVFVVVGLVLLALVIWALRRVFGLLLKCLPVALAVGGTVAVQAAYRIGESLDWDTPGSPALLLVYAALAAAAILAVAGWVALGLQIRGWLRPGPRPTPEYRATVNALQVGLAIVVIVLTLFSAYRFHRSHRPTHDANVAQMVFAPSGEFLYSLDEAGVLKQWDVARHFEVRRWLLPGAGAERPETLLVSADGRTLLALAGDTLVSWRLARAAEAIRVAAIANVVAIAPVNAESFTLLQAYEISVRRYADALRPTAKLELAEPALGLAASGAGRIVVGGEDGRLRFYAVELERIAALATPVSAPLDLVPRRLLADRGGRYVVATDGESRIAIVDFQEQRVDELPDALYAETLAISGSGELLLGAIGITSYDPGARRSMPLFNHGGRIAALAADPHDDTIAIADRRQIYLRGDGRRYAAEDVWLNGRVELPAITAPVLALADRLRAVRR